MPVLSINDLEDAIKSLAQSLQVSTVFPAGLFVLVNAYFIVPTFYPDLDCSTPQAVTVIISLTLMLSYIFYALNFPLIRFFEGYRFDYFLPDRIADLIEHDLKSTQKQMRRGKLEQKKFSDIDRDFPSEDRVLPTKIGNVIAAFEQYPETRYGMDSIALWPRLVPVLKDEEFLDYVVQEKAVFDFLLNTWVVTAVLGVELTYRATFLWDFVPAFFIFIATLLSCAVLYEGMYIAARQWGTVVKVAFDRHRHDLAKSLYLKPAKTFSEEWNRWKAVSEFFLYHKTGDYRSFDAFIPQSEVLQYKQTTKPSENNDKSD
jgi:hypothetical protein